MARRRRRKARYGMSAWDDFKFNSRGGTRGRARGFLARLFRW